MRDKRRHDNNRKEVGSRDSRHALLSSSTGEDVMLLEAKRALAKRHFVKAYRLVRQVLRNGQDRGRERNSSFKCKIQDWGRSIDEFHIIIDVIFQFADVHLSNEKGGQNSTKARKICGLNCSSVLHTKRKLQDDQPVLRIGLISTVPFSPSPEVARHQIETTMLGQCDKNRSQNSLAAVEESAAFLLQACYELIILSPSPHTSSKSKRQITGPTPVDMVEEVMCLILQTFCSEEAEDGAPSMSLDLATLFVQFCMALSNETPSRRSSHTHIPEDLKSRLRRLGTSLCANIVGSLLAIHSIGCKHGDETINNTKVRSKKACHGCTIYGGKYLPVNLHQDRYGYCVRELFHLLFIQTLPYTTEASVATLILETLIPQAFLRGVAKLNGGCYVGPTDAHVLESPMSAWTHFSVDVQRQPVICVLDFLHNHRKVYLPSQPTATNAHVMELEWSFPSSSCCFERLWEDVTRRVEALLVESEPHDQAIGAERKPPADTRNKGGENSLMQKDMNAEPVPLLEEVQSLLQTHLIEPLWTSENRWENRVKVATATLCVLGSAALLGRRRRLKPHRQQRLQIGSAPDRKASALIAAASLVLQPFKDVVEALIPDS
jgi:hypothetical protein